MALRESTDRVDSRGPIHEAPWTFRTADEAFGWTTQREPTHMVLRLYGEVDLYTVSPLQGAIDDLVRQGYVHLAIDLTDVSFLDSSGIALLVWAHKLTNQCDGELAVRNPSERIRRLMEITGVHKLFTVSADDEGQQVR